MESHTDNDEKSMVNFFLTISLQFADVISFYIFFFFCCNFFCSSCCCSFNSKRIVHVLIWNFHLIAGFELLSTCIIPTKIHYVFLFFNIYMMCTQIHANGEHTHTHMHRHTRTTNTSQPVSENDGMKVFCIGFICIYMIVFVVPLWINVVEHWCSVSFRSRSM